VVNPFKDMSGGYNAHINNSFPKALGGN
jgi:hypothetical protein